MRREIAISTSFALIFAAFAARTAVCGDPSQQNRRDNYNDARDTAKKGNQNQLQPQMMGHLMKAAEHRKQAQQARQQQNEGEAQQQERMAQMEQQKAQQLGNQMKANDQSAQQNQNGADKTTDDSGQGQQRTYTDNGKPIRQQAGYNRASTTIDSGQPQPIRSGPTIPDEQIANLSAAAGLIRPPSAEPISETTAPTMEEGTGGISTGAASLTMISTPKDDPAPPPAPINPPSSGGGGVSDGGGGGGFGGGTIFTSSGPTNALDKEGEFWKMAEAETEEETEEGKKPEFDLIALRGSKRKDPSEDTPGKKLSDAAFWKQAGGEPKACRKIRGRSASTTARRARCLRSERAKLERKWRKRERTTASTSTDKGLITSRDPSKR